MHYILHTQKKEMNLRWLHECTCGPDMYGYILSELRTPFQYCDHGTVLQRLVSPSCQAITEAVHE